MKVANTPGDMHFIVNWKKLQHSRNNIPQCQINILKYHVFMKRYHVRITNNKFIKRFGTQTYQSKSERVSKDNCRPGLVFACKLSPERQPQRYCDDIDTSTYYSTQLTKFNSYIMKAMKYKRESNNIINTHSLNISWFSNIVELIKHFRIQQSSSRF